ncbi:integrase catalytic domain-containing protein [Trichonephila inaurata madagascariensis]|uniref:Integrase catalytic domain-containing protein n=1 Tax=Trichonephila inaurata madagascariensis TaxID=2747483 RepID=A0A8X6Y1X7_9ARAC|nr:integrase catalytic domain-containing protein [Trichonephila inaurata madagascariensis]
MTRKLIVRKKDDILDTLEAILVAIDTQLVPSVENSDFEVKNQSSSQTSVSSQSDEVKLPTLFLPIFSGVTEEERQAAVNVSNSSGLSVNAPVFSPAPIPSTSEPSENSRIMDVTLYIFDVSPDVQTLLCTVLIQVRDIYIYGNYQRSVDAFWIAEARLCLLQMSVLKGRACEKKRLMFVYRVWAHPIRVQMGLLRFTSRFPSQNSFHASV